MRATRKRTTQAGGRHLCERRVLHAHRKDDPGEALERRGHVVLHAGGVQVELQHARDRAARAAGV